jgi:hypothetical protein
MRHADIGVSSEPGMGELLRLTGPPLPSLAECVARMRHRYPRKALVNRSLARPVRQYHLAIVSALSGLAARPSWGCEGRMQALPRDGAGVLTHAGLDCDVGEVLTYLGRRATQILHMT